MGRDGELKKGRRDAIGREVNLKERSNGRNGEGRKNGRKEKRQEWERKDT